MYCDLISRCVSFSCKFGAMIVFIVLKSLDIDFGVGRDVGIVELVFGVFVDGLCDGVFSVWFFLFIGKLRSSLSVCLIICALERIFLWFFFYGCCVVMIGL